MSQGEMGAMRQPMDFDTDLLEFLYDRYNNGDIAGEQLQAIANFVASSQAYLSSNRPVMTFPADNNMGIVLQDNTRLILAPAAGTVAERDGGMVQAPKEAQQAQGLDSHGAFQITTENLKGRKP